MKILNKIKIRQIFKAYTEGIYADTPANRKLGRVGMTYEAYAEKVKKEKEDSSKESEIEGPTKKEDEKKSTKNVFTIDQIKEKVQSEIKKLKKKNDYITLSDSKGNTYRFSYNRNADKNGKGLNECLVKDKEGNILKNFKNSHEEDLMNSVYKYIQSLDTDIIPIESGGNEEVSIEHNTVAIKKKMQEAKNSQIGTILVKGSGDKLIYLNRDRKGRWLKDFNNYTIRDFRRNIISQGKADSEEELINKLNEYLSKNKIKLEI